MTGGVFSSTTSRVLVAVCGLSLLAGFLLAIFQDQLEPTRSNGTDSYSRSALGHKGFRHLLEDMDVPVVASRFDSATKAGFNGTLVVAEPDLAINPTQRVQLFEQMPMSAFTMLVVLPKRRGLTDPERPTWLSSVNFSSNENIQLILDTMGIEGKTVRGKSSAAMRWNAGEWNHTPLLEEAQLLVSRDLDPIIATEEGILLGYYFSEDEDNPFCYVDIFVLTDPDLLANHGLGRGKNAALAMKIIDYLRQGEGLVVIDETLHGHQSSDSSFAAFFRFPLIFVTMQILVTAAALLWMAGGRFGSPVRASEIQTRGPEVLIDNTADLLHYSGHSAFVLRRYFQSSLNRICRRLRVDLPGSRPAARERFINISHSRSSTFDFAKMETDIKVRDKLKSNRPGEVLDTAEAIYRWQQEMTNGL